MMEARTFFVVVMGWLMAAPHQLITADQPTPSVGLLATTPSQWMTGTEEKVCFVSQPSTPALQVRVEVIRTTLEKILVSRLTLNSGQSDCIIVNVPKNLTVNDVLLVVDAQSADLSYHFLRNATITLKRFSPMIFIQTDKPIYKPADTVKIRILTLTGADLKPVPDQISLAYIEDPSKTRVVQWTNIDVQNGLASLELPLSSDPTLGLWTIKVTVQGHEQTTQFEVKEYVPPKFDVQIIVEPKISSKYRQMKWKVCARYTYGEPVAGHVNTSVCFKNWNRGYDANTCVTYNNTELANGCAELIGDIRLLKGNRTYLTGYNLMLNAQVTERGTGITLNSSRSSTWDDSLMSIDISDSPSVYKPGMPYNGHGSVTYLDGSTAAGINVTVDITGRQNSLLNLTTDQSGKFVFSTTAEFTAGLNRSFTVKASLPAARNQINLVNGLSGNLTDPIASGTKYIQPWFSASESYLQIQPVTLKDLVCGSPITVRVLYISKEHVNQAARFHYQVTSRGNIIVSNNLEVNRVSNTAYDFSFSFVVAPSMSNSLKLLVFYIRPDGEMIADSLMTSFEQCFENKVSMEFNKAQAQPGHSVSLSLTADPESLCSVAVVDKSIELMGAKYITKQSVVDKLSSLYAMQTSTRRWADHGSMQSDCIQKSGRDDEYDDDDDDAPWVSVRRPPGPPGVNAQAPWQLSRSRPRRMIMYPGPHSNVVDSQKPFKDMGLVVLTDLTLTTRPCVSYGRYRQYYYDGSISSRRVAMAGLPGPPGMAVYTSAIPMEVSKSEPPGSKSTPALHRTYFPETWLWDLHHLGSTGKKEVAVSLPHTITEWVGSGFCVGQQSGLGISSPFKVTAFQPFFVSFTLPYSMIRGEKVAIPVSVFNYLTECLQVTLLVDKSSDFRLVNDTHKVSLKVCGRETEVRTFFLIPKQIGTVNFTVRASSAARDRKLSNSVYTEEQTNSQDIVTRQLLVKAEGKEEELTKSLFLCEAASGNLSFSLPADVVTNSTRAHVSVIGDVMGPALSGLDSLLAMPYGCGEQNMVLFAPNIFILQYFNKTKRLTVDVHTKALSFMQTGYQRELTYRHADGSYSAFGKSDTEGSIWLTAFVVKSFAQAKPYMFIDEEDLKMSTDWMISKQLQNGCFPQVGRVFSKSMKGGMGSSSSLTPLTAYILISLLEAGVDTNLPVIVNAVNCLQSETTEDAYTLSLIAYAYSLMERNGQSGSSKTHVLNKLNNLAVMAGGMKHWTSGPKVIEEGFYSYSSPADVEMTAYVLLALLQSNNLSVIPQATPIVRWLSSQRNARGGFASTQDTVLALQALAQYAGLVHRDDINLKAVISTGDIHHTFRIASDNSLLLQKHEGLPELKNVKYSLEGIGCALLQASMKYNRQSLASNDQTPAFDLRVTVQSQKTGNCKERTLDICAKYAGHDAASNMVVVAVKMVSGWIPDKSSIQKLRNQARLGLKKFEFDKDTIQLYFDEMDKVDRCFSFDVIQSQQVADTKPALVHVYDYYAPKLSTFSQYTIESTCPFNEVLMVRSLNAARPDVKVPTPKPNRQNHEDQKTTLKVGQNGSPKVVKSKCPACKQASLEALCKSPFVYKWRVGLNGSLEVLSTIRFQSKSALPRMGATYKYRMAPNCSCRQLQSGSTVLVGSSSKFSKTGDVWLLVLNNRSIIRADDDPILFRIEMIKRYITSLNPSRASTALNSHEHALA